MAALMGGAGAGNAYNPAADNDQGEPPAEELRDCINALHKLMVTMPDAQHVALIHQALAPLLKIQAELSQAANQPRNNVLNHLAS